MLKRIFGITISVFLLAMVAFTGFAVWHSSSTQPEFRTDGYVLMGDGLEAKQLAFTAAAPYKVSSAGVVKFEDTSGEKVTVKKESFVHYGDGSVMALSDGILLDFNDLSDNFINNYFISAGLPIQSAGEGYTAETTAGTITFGDHLWKLSDQKYLIRSSELTVYYSENDQREVEDYVQIHITDDGIVQILTPENIWMTISEECYVETASGVRIYPVTQLINDDTYKMSLAKLSVTADDSIVLTEDETRRQIVPEIHIETIDGEDGLDGEEGQAGAQGVTGEDGIDGENGVSGNKGQTGEKGKSGEDGEDGAAGRSGSSGSDGADGSNGQGGLTGNPGQTGNNAVVDSSTNTALPTMTFADWEVTATSLRGMIAIDDPNGFLLESAGDDDHRATVRICDVETGEEILCYEMNDTYTEFLSTAAAWEGYFDGIYEGDEVYFSTINDPLKPDTRYRISVHAYYVVNETVYSREFISRAFYTDSTGVYLSEKSADDRSITLNVSVAEAYQNSITTAEVYLLTPGQNDSFSLTSNEDYEYKIELDYTTGKWTLYEDGTLDPNTSGPFNKDSDDFTFDGIYNTETSGHGGLPSDTKYIARVRVVSGSMDSLTKQELEVSTLKKTPTWTDTPKATYNRVTGGFEVWRPAVTDPDGGAVNYTYTAYVADDEGNFTREYQSRTLTPGESEPAVFFLNSGVEYRFGVTLQFNDNEKIVQYDLGQSNIIKAEGASLPSVNLNIENQGTEYDEMSGTIRINLTGDQQSLTVDATHPLELNVYSDQIYDRTISINSTDTVTGKDGAETIYTAAYTPSSVSTQTDAAEITLSLYHLYKNSNYTVTLIGYLDVGDGNGPVKRAIGTVSFRTYDTVPLTAIMDRSDGSSAISMSLRLTANDTTIQNASARNAYAMNQLRNGQVELQLYAGTGYGATLLATTNIDNDDGDLDKVFGSEGLEVTEAMFGSPTLNPSADYTLRVSSVKDQTYDMDMGYVNEFTTINNASAIIVAEATPPDLLMNPAKGVTAEPIYKKDAAKFGVTDYANMNDMPDDAIVGYTVQANYDNAQRLGLNVTYYAMEYGAYFAAVTNKNANDPLGEDGITKLMEVTLPISKESDIVPKVAFLFGRSAASTESVYANGYYVYRTGEANDDGGQLLSGMDRGYRYVFAYTVEYSRTGEADNTAIYPYGHTAYDQYKGQFGVGQEYGKTLGKGNFYILNSGMCEAPRVMPQFYTYLNNVTGVDVRSGGTGATSSGSAVIHYTWTNDVDNTISLAYGKKTQIQWLLPQEGSADIDGTAVSGASTGMTGNSDAKDWYAVTVPYTVDPSELTNLIRPTVQIEQYVLDYDEIMYDLRDGTVYKYEDDSFYLCKMPVDWAWGQYFKTAGETATFTFDIEEDKNYIQFNVVADAGSQFHTLLASRAYALKVTMTAETKEKTFYLPLENSLTGGIYARLATGLLGDDFVNKVFDVKASILYDTGDQGWSLAAQNDNSFIGLQYAGTAETPALGDYYVINSKGATATSSSPKNGLMTVLTKGALTTIRVNALIDPEKNSEAVSTISFQQYYAQGKSGGINRYLRATHSGVDQSSSPSALTGSFLTVKAVGEYELACSGTTSSGTITKIIPTVSFLSDMYTPGTTQVRLNSFAISGAAQANSREVIVRLFEDVKDISSGTALQEKTFELNDNDRWIVTSDETGDGTENGVFGGLKPDTNYVLAFYMTINGEEILLMQTDGSSDAIYTVKTSTDIEITSAMSLVRYLNQSYFDKSLQLDFKLSRAWGIKMRYDIFTSEAAAETMWSPDSTAIPHLSYEDMTTSGILTEPAALNTTSNILTINMTPSAARSKLTPGGTYYLRVTALEESSGSMVSVGSAVFGAVIPPIGNYGALVYVKNATHEKIEYEVTINDAQFSFMGSSDYLNGSGLYAVRFTYTDADGIESRIVTTYDQNVFSASEAKKGFELSTSTVDTSWAGAYEFTINPDTEYKLHVYAVVDPRHTGVSYPTDSASGKDGWSWTTFFNDVAGGISTWFTDFINSFWQNGTYMNDASMDAIENKFHVAEKVQKTTITDGVLLNTAKAAVGRVSETQLRLILPESFGLIDFASDSSGEQIYKKIAWDVEGHTVSGVAVHYNGTSLTSNGDLMIQRPLEGADPGYEYYYDIPQDITSGTYYITIQFYKNADSAEHETLSFTYYG